VGTLCCIATLCLSTFCSVSLTTGERTFKVSQWFALTTARRGAWHGNQFDPHDWNAQHNERMGPCQDLLGLQIQVITLVAYVLSTSRTCIATLAKLATSAADSLVYIANRQCRQTQ